MVPECSQVGIGAAARYRSNARLFQRVTPSLESRGSLDERSKCEHGWFTMILHRGRSRFAAIWRLLFQDFTATPQLLISRLALVADDPSRVPVVEDDAAS
jgi:hypothetical protein